MPVESGKQSTQLRRRGGARVDDTELDPARLNLYSYLTAGQSEQHVRIMRVLAGEVLTRQMSAAEISAKLSSDRYPVKEEDVEARCKQLVDWGNIIPSVRNYRVATIAELRRTKSRYQASKLGVGIASDVDEILGADDGAKEVARELLDVIAEQLGRVLAELKPARHYWPCFGPASTEEKTSPPLTRSSYSREVGFRPAEMST